MEEFTLGERLMLRKAIIGLLPLSIILLTLLPIVSSSTVSTFGISAYPPEISSSLDVLVAAYPSLRTAINLDAVGRHMEFFSGLGTRAVGYEGNWRAAQYICNKFVEYGLKDVSYYNFTVVDAISYGANITILESGRVIKLHPLWPNMVCPSTTPPEGIKGKLIYAKSGYLEDFEIGAKEANADVNGSIVLLDWYTSSRWINAARLGAKAVIFIPPTVLGYGTIGALHEKFLPDSPFLFPRFYVDKESAEVLLQNVGKEVHLVSSQKWRKVTSWNIIGYVPGEKPDSIIMLSSYYDSKSIAPTVSPGAEESIGISMLLEIAKFFAKPENKPKNTLMFVAFSGHHNELWGATILSKDLFSIYTWQSNPERFREGLKIKMNINIDVSAGSKVLYFVAEGNELNYFGGDTLWLGVYGNMRMYIDAILGKVHEDKPFGRTYEKTYFFGKNAEYEMYLRSDVEKVADGRVLAWRDFIYDHEPFWANYVPSFTITTAYDPRPQYGEPFDTMDWVNSRPNAWENIAAQFDQIISVIYAIANEGNLDVVYKGWQMDRRENPPLRYAYFGTIAGRVGEYSLEKAYYVPVPNALVYLRVAISNTRTGYYYRRLFTFADETGKFEVFPIVSRYWAPKVISAWVIDEDTGRIIYAPDLGRYKYMPRTLPGDLPSYPVSDFGWLAVFKASLVVLFDIVDPDTLTLYKPEVGGFQMPQMSVLKSDTKVEPDRFSGIGGEWSTGSVVVLFVPPFTDIEVVWLFAPSRYPYAILNNANEKNPLGVGYVLMPGEQKVFPYTALRYAEYLYWATSERIKILERIEPGIYASPSYKRYSTAKALMEEAYQTIKSRDYRKAYTLIFQAWYNIRRAYFELRPKIEDSISVVPILAAFLLPFVYLAEKLIFSASGVKRIITFVGTFAFIMLAFYFIHPGFQLAASPITIVVGFSTLILCLPILVIIISYVQSYMAELRLERLGRHEVKVSRLSEVDHAFLTGVENMRRMKLRTTLTLVSVIIMISSLVNVASITSEKVMAETFSAGGVANYQGVFIRRYLWGQGSVELGDNVLELLKEIYGSEAKIAPRAWRYSAFYGSLSAYPQRVGFMITHGDKRVTAIVLWGLTPEEKYLLKTTFWLRAGRWFEPGDRRVIIINDYQAKLLGINESDLERGPVPVIFEGLPYYVIGIVDRLLVERMLEMDGEGVTPLKFDLDYNPYNIHVDMNYVFILPFEEVRNLGGSIASISLMFENEEAVIKAASEIAEILPQYLTYFTRRDPETKELICYMMSERLAYTVRGFEFQAIPMSIVVLAILNIILGSVYERRRDISIYNVVGLSPLHISIMFVAESVIYALVGGMIGYLSAMFTTKLIGIIAPQFALPLNYSSAWVMIALGAAAGATILSSLYPAWVASRLVTPSLERAWRITTKPRGDVWEIPLPFHARENEAKGIIEYLYEYMYAHSAPEAPDFSVLNLNVSKGEVEGKKYVSIDATVRLAPYEAGISEEINFSANEIAPDRWEMRVIAKRLTGPSDRWMRLHRIFVDHFRKQLLLWGSITPSERAKYIERAKKKY
ncbi:MAG: M28 family peptidase [Candidatus Bathyarchaeia archaeon]